ncbi:MAG TPA: hypothetical protein VNQ76_14165 [Planctomicrobium sp.]|nr:hypothetical protein [Planctomicrobium sp.]
MKAKLVREHDVLNPDYNRDHHTLCVARGERYPISMTKKAPAGTIIDHPEAWRLVTLGAAVPEDDECRQRAGLTEKQMEKVIAAAERLSLGIGYDIPGQKKNGKKEPAPA